MWYYYKYSLNGITMSINSISSDYSDLIRDITNSQANEIRKNVSLMLENAKVAQSAMIAEELIMGAIEGQYQPDTQIPEDSTVSYHV